MYRRSTCTVHFHYYSTTAVGEACCLHTHPSPVAVSKEARNHETTRHRNSYDTSSSHEATHHFSAAMTDMYREPRVSEAKLTAYPHEERGQEVR